MPQSCAKELRVIDTRAFTLATALLCVLHMLPLPFVTGSQLKALIPFWAEALVHHSCPLHSVDHFLLYPASKVAVGLVHLFFMHEGNLAVGITGAWGGPAQECTRVLSPNTTAN